jgi:HK97 family phage major capsid protein
MFVQLQKEFMGRKVGERIDVSDSDGNLLIKDGVATPVTDDLITPAVQRAMEQAFGGFQKGLDAVIQTALKQFADAQSKSRRHAVPAIFGEHGDGDPKKTFGAFLIAVAQRDQKTLESLGSRFNGWDAKVALNEQTGTQGGYTVPTQFHDELFGLIKDMSIVESRATQVPASTAVLEIPVLDITQTPTAGETAYFGGVQANWEEEASTTGQEEPTFKQLRLQPRELKGYTLASNSLLADNAIGLEALLKTLFAGAVAWHEDRVCSSQ